ncbi:MAG: VanW family protein [bacterium]|nr:VanW family protein [bacterium]
MTKIISYIKERRFLKWSLLAVVVLLLLVLVLFAFNFFVNKNYQNVFLPGTKIGSVDIGELTFEEAKSKLDKRVDFINRRGFVYVTPSKTVTIYPSASAIESADSISMIVSWEITKSLENISQAQRENGLADFLLKARLLISGHNYPLLYHWDQDQHLAILEQSFVDILSDKKEANFEFLNGALKINPESAGETFDYGKAMVDTKPLIEELSSVDITLKVIEDKPLISSKIIETFEPEILSISQKGDLTISYQEDNWTISSDVWKTWLAIKVKTEEQGFYIGINNEKFANYLQESGIKEKLEILVQDARFKLENGKVSEFISSQNGQTIDMEASLKELENKIFNDTEIKLALIIDIVEPKVGTQDVNDLGIVEIIGTGESDFTGSPVNRIHNIGVGADTLNGILIAPDEEFSLVKTLGEIDGEHGYKQELVIKGNRTIPEYGGGLCQIGTTVFRSALASGLPITERRNHSYRVVYYEPAGTDATIYSPWPDLKFKNDTGHYILVQSRIEGKKIYFDFWGTKDGRIVQTTEPVIYNLVSPPPSRIVKTTDIEPGQKKCTERAHTGADAKFDYSVQYPKQAEPVETTFYSHYVPWQEVCLLGVTEEELLAEQNQTATSTDEQL